MTKLEPAQVYEQRINELLDHLENWLRVQPEWLYLVALPDRQVRHRVAKLIAKELMTIPTFESEGLPRNLRRPIMRELQRTERAWFKGLEGANVTVPPVHEAPPALSYDDEQERGNDV